MRSGSAGSRSDLLLLDEEAEEGLSARRVRAWLEGAGREIVLVARKRAQVRHLHLDELLDPLPRR